MIQVIRDVNGLWQVSRRRALVFKVVLRQVANDLGIQAILDHLFNNRGSGHFQLQAKGVIHGFVRKVNGHVIAPVKGIEAHRLHDIEL